MTGQSSSVTEITVYNNYWIKQWKQSRRSNKNLGHSE